MTAWKYAMALSALGLGGCQTAGVAGYTPSRDTLFYLQQAGPAQVAVLPFEGITQDFGDVTKTGLYSGCALEVKEDPDWSGPADYLRMALVEELRVGGIYEAEGATNALHGKVETLSFTRDPVFGGAWHIAVTLTASDGTQLRHDNAYKFDVGALGGPTVCRRAIAAFQPAVVQFWETAAQTPEFRRLLTATRG